MKQNKAFVVIIPFFMLVAAFEVLPLALVIMDSFKTDNGGLGLTQFITVFSSRYYIQSIGNSLYISISASLIALAITLITAYSITRLGPAFRNLMLNFSSMVSNFAGIPLAFAFIIMFGQNGFIRILLKGNGIGFLEGFNLYSRMGLVLIYTYFSIPLGILLLYPAFDNLKEEWKEAVQVVGGTKFQFWRFVGIPVLSKSILGTWIILFSNAMGAYATALALTNGNYNLLTIRIAALISGDMYLNPNLASALSLILGLVLTGAVLLNEFILKKQKEVKS